MAHIETISEEKIVHVGGYTYTINVQDIPPKYKEGVIQAFEESLNLVYGRTISNASSSLVDIVYKTIIV